MDNNGWKDISTCPCGDKPEDARMVLVWHVFQGFIVCSTRDAPENRFNVYWREPPEEWIDPHDRLPTKDDADEQNCVLIVDSHGEMRVTGWHQIQDTESAMKWAARPEPPSDYKILRRTAN